MTIVVTIVPPNEIDALTDQLLDVYRGAFTPPPYNEDAAAVQRFAETLAAHARRAGFTCAIARDEQTHAVAGFGYGYTSQPGQWWHDTVTPMLPPAIVARWFSDCFEMVELAVLPTAQGQGAGGRLHDALLAAVPHATAALTTLREETAALQLYRKRGWQPLVDPMLFPGAARAYVVLGRELRSAADLSFLGR